MTTPQTWTGRTTLAIAATMGGQAVGASAQLAPAVLAIEIARHAGVQPAMIGVYTGCVFLAAAISSLFCGEFIARYGAIRAVQFGVCLSGAGAALAATGHPAALLASALVAGFGYGPMTPASSVVLSRWSPPNRLGLIMSIKQTGVPLGYFCTGICLPFASAAIGWQTALLALSCIAVSVAVVIAPASRRLDERRTGAISGGFASARASLGFLKSHHRLRRIAIASLAFAGVQVTVTSFLVVYLEADIGLDKQLAAWPLAVAGVAAVGGRIGWGWLADAAPTARLLALLPALMALSLLFLLSAGAGWGYVILTGLGLALGLTVMAWNGVMLIEAARQAPEGQIGMATSGVLALTFFGSMIFPQLLSVIVGAIGSYAVGYIGMMVALVAVGLWYLPDAVRKL